jgi:hypothetical protein
MWNIESIQPKPRRNLQKMCEVAGLRKEFNSGDIIDPITLFQFDQKYEGIFQKLCIIRLC